MAGAGSTAERAGVESLRPINQRLSLLAECCVEAAAAWSAPPAPKGRRPDWAIFALGKLGSRELTVHSDLDLVVVYDGDPRDSATFMARQDLVAAIQRMLEEPTADGVAYRVDTRLRPEGKKGALAMPVVAFERYLGERAEIWERMAWTRGRWIAGSRAVGEHVDAAVRQFVYGEWDERIPTVMADIRRRMERELVQSGARHLEYKIGCGGLADIDFVLQMIQIRAGAADAELRVSGTREALGRLRGTPWLVDGELDDLERAYAFLRRLELYARMDVDANVGALATAPEQLRVVGKRMGLPDPAGESLLEEFGRVTARVRGIYETVLARLGAAAE
jgi:glutamate-ammonia-ligase adenylyltransferase